MGRHKVLGLMSGTSLDGLDMAVCEFWQGDGRWAYSLGPTKDVPYAPDMREALSGAIHLTVDRHTALDRKYGIWLGKQSKAFLEETGSAVDFIASHGHTSHHRPDRGITFQLGEGQALADHSGLPVVCDFRRKDVSLGGQGAPLVPIGDELLFPDFDFCLNLGGISNISFDQKGRRIAFDIGLANMPLNHIARSMGLEFDGDGALARSGTLDPELLDRLDRLPYYRMPPPKSTGLEWFKGEVLPLVEASRASQADLLHTFVHHNAAQIATVVQGRARGPKSKVLVTGGGALNGFFMETLQEKLGRAHLLQLPDKGLIAYKEALIFALMGALRLEGKINVLRSVTGAREDSCSGELFFPARRP